MPSPEHAGVLRKLHARLSRAGVRWAIGGSLGMALQGVDVDARDIDLVTDAAGAYAIERLFSDSMESPVRLSATERVRSHFGALRIDGVSVEIIGDMQHHLENGGWSDPTALDAGSFLRHAALEELDIPVLALEYEYWSYLRMGRVERAEMLRAWLEARMRPNSGE